MAVDSNFASLLQNLKLEDPWLPSRHWESIPSESGDSKSDNLYSTLSPEPLYDPSTISEANLVRLAINALQGVHSALESIEKLSAAFCSDPADRTCHRNPSLWHRSSSTNALGKILKSIGCSGFSVLLIRKFVDYFLCTDLNLGGESIADNKVGRRAVAPKSAESQFHFGDEVGVHPPYSLVNQAFSIAVGKVLEGFICALDTLYASVELRRSSKNVDALPHVSSMVGCLTTMVHSEITLLEVYLHTKELRTHIEALGNICYLKNINLAFSQSSLEVLTTKATAEFCNFPISGNLLTYLYTQLRDADPVHRTLLKFLFLRSYEPYCGFIKSWIYQARISDPYKEFVVEYVDNSSLYSHGQAGFSHDFPLAAIKERVGVTIPCFLKDFCLPLLRAGQQLQVLVKLLELCNYVSSTEDHNYDDILPCWSGSSSDHLSYSSSLTFNKRKLEGMVLTRASMYKKMQEKLQNLFTRLDIRCQQVISLGTVPIFVDNSTNSLNVRVPYTSDESLVSPSSTADNGDSNLAMVTKDSDSSSTEDEFSYVVDTLVSSECSSLDSFEGKNEAEEPSELHCRLIEMEPRYSSASGLSTSFSIENLLRKPPQSEKPHALKWASRETCESMDAICHSVNSHHKEMNPVPHQFESSTWSRMSETKYVDYQSDICWPLGGLSKNPFYADGGYKDRKQVLFANSSLKVTDTNMEVLKGVSSDFGEVFPSDPSHNFLQKEATSRIQLENESDLSSTSFVSPQWKLKYNYNFLNINPMLTKNSWFHMTSKSGYRSCMDNKRSFLYFDFSSVEDPCKAYGERFLSGPPNHELSFFTGSNVSPGGANEYPGEQGHNRDDVPVDQAKLIYDYSTSNSKENSQEEDFLAKVSGGAEWENSLSYSNKAVVHSTGDHSQPSTATFEMPLDVIIDKCILQEILLQYKYVSSFTMKLLEEGFDLREHLLALRRYHFMELADWADLFIMSLWNHKWYVAETNQGISEIQGLLDFAVQRSSCERDPYKERVFVYMKGQGKMPLSTTSIGIRSFNFIALGYRVDWPVSIVLTSGALKIYAQIFSFLIQVKLALFSLTDVWCSLKDLVHLISDNHNSGVGEKASSYFNILVKLRHQVNHFVSTLQQYVQSQLSHVSWCRFLHSLKHQVKDLLDVESVHMAYLADSLHICFLSEETKSVASIIESILQCALDFRSCFRRGVCEVGLERRDSQGLPARINFSLVLTIKEIFEKNLKELFVLYLKSPKHGEFGLFRFWGHLNYNDYYSNVIGNGMNYYALGA